MSNIELTITEGFLTAFKQEQKRSIYEKLSKKLAESAQDAIHIGFKRSTELAAMIGQRADSEAIRTIIRGLKVIILNVDPLILEAKFEDDYAHWYSGQDLPDDVAKTLQNIIDISVNNWLESSETGKIVGKVLMNEI